MPLKVQKNIPIPEPTEKKQNLRMGTGAAKSAEWSGLPRGQMQATVLQQDKGYISSPTHFLSFLRNRPI